MDWFIILFHVFHLFCNYMALVGNLYLQYPLI